MIYRKLESKAATEKYNGLRDRARRTTFFYIICHLVTSDLFSFLPYVCVSNLNKNSKILKLKKITLSGNSKE